MARSSSTSRMRRTFSRCVVLELPARRHLDAHPAHHRPRQKGFCSSSSRVSRGAEAREKKKDERRTARLSSSRLLVFCLLRPGRLDPVHPRVRDELPEVFVQVAAHDERRLDDRAVAAEELLRSGDLRLVEPHHRLARVGKALGQVLDAVYVLIGAAKSSVPVCFCTGSCPSILTNRSNRCRALPIFHQRTPSGPLATAPSSGKVSLLSQLGGGVDSGQSRSRVQPARRNEIAQTVRSRWFIASDDAL